MSDRWMMCDPLTGYTNIGVTQASVTGGYWFGRTADKTAVADNINDYRTMVRWRMRMMLSADVGPVSANFTQAQKDAISRTNANIRMILGPNEIDAPQNWTVYYLNYTLSPVENTIPRSSILANRVGTIFENDRPLLFLRIQDQMRYVYQAVNDPLAAGGAGRSDVACIAPAVIEASLSTNRTFNIYDWFAYEDTAANVGVRKGDMMLWADAGQVHCHVTCDKISNPWAADPDAAPRATVSPWHWWTAKQTNDAYRAGAGLPVLPRPLIDGESGRNVMGNGAIVTGRTSLDYAHLRRTMYGMWAKATVYWGMCFKSFYSLANSGDYGMNLLTYGTATQTLNSLTGATLATAGTGYVAGTIYNFNGFTTPNIAPSIKVMTIGGGGTIATFQLVYTGYGLGITTTPLTLAAPSGGTSATFNVTWATPSRFSKVGDLGENDIDYLTVVGDYRDGDIDAFTSTGTLTWSIPIVAKPASDYWKDWTVWFNIGTPLAGASTVVPWPEWNRVAFTANLITCAAGGRNLIVRTLHSRHTTLWDANGIVGRLHTATAECRLSNDTNGRARISMRGFNKLNGLVENVSAVLVGSSGTGVWTQLTVSWTHVAHNNPKLPDPLTSLLSLDHNGSGTCEWRNVTVSVAP